MEDVFFQENDRAIKSFIRDLIIVLTDALPKHFVNKQWQEIREFDPDKDDAIEVHACLIVITDKIKKILLSLPEEEMPLIKFHSCLASYFCSLRRIYVVHEWLLNNFIARGGKTEDEIENMIDDTLFCEDYILGLLIGLTLLTDLIEQTYLMLENDLRSKKGEDARVISLFPYQIQNIS